MSDFVVEYGKKKVELSRDYGFNSVEVVVKGKKKKVTVLEINELTGNDDVLVEKQEKAGQHSAYVQVSVSTGITYEEALTIAQKDTAKIMNAIQNF